MVSVVAANRLFGKSASKGTETVTNDTWPEAQKFKYSSAKPD